MATSFSYEDYKRWCEAFKNQWKGGEKTGCHP